MRGLAADASDGRVPFEIIGDGLTEVAVHEVGHTLGLRHNFKGSTLIPFTKIYDGEYTSKHGKSSSIMDYTAAVIAPTKEQQDKAKASSGQMVKAAFKANAAQSLKSRGDASKKESKVTFSDLTKELPRHDSEAGPSVQPQSS